MVQKEKNPLYIQKIPHKPNLLKAKAEANKSQEN